MSNISVKYSFPKFDNSISNANFAKTAIIAKERAKKSIRNNKRTGRKWPNLPGTSSGVGHAPAHQGTVKNGGPLVNSIKYKTALGGKTIKTVTLYAETPYALILEEGGHTGRARIAARPYLRPAMDFAFRNYNDRFDIDKTIGTTIERKRITRRI